MIFPNLAFPCSSRSLNCSGRMPPVSTGGGMPVAQGVEGRQLKQMLRPPKAQGIRGFADAVASQPVVVHLENDKDDKNDKHGFPTYFIRLE